MTRTAALEWGLQASWHDRGSNYSSKLYRLTDAATRKAVEDRAATLFDDMQPRRNVIVSVLCRPIGRRLWTEAGVYQRPPTGGAPYITWHTRNLFGLNQINP